MRILTKEEFVKEPVGTVFCCYAHSCLYGDIQVKIDYHIRPHDGKPGFNGVIPLVPWFDDDADYFVDTSHPERTYPTACYSTDTADIDFDDDQLFAVFSNDEVRRMIDVLTYALCGCNGSQYTDDMVMR